MEYIGGHLRCGYLSCKIIGVAKQDCQPKRFGFVSFLLKTFY